MNTLFDWIGRLLHRHIYHTVRQVYIGNGNYRYIRETYEFCIRCGDDKPWEGTLTHNV